jgi:hypothetical protein
MGSKQRTKPSCAVSSWNARVDNVRREVWDADIWSDRTPSEPPTTQRRPRPPKGRRDCRRRMAGAGPPCRCRADDETSAPEDRDKKWRLDLRMLDDGQVVQARSRDLGRARTAGVNLGKSSSFDNGEERYLRNCWPWNYTVCERRARP